MNELRSPRGARKKSRRRGRGRGSGRGKTCGRGSKGIMARTGGSLRPGFEGGQMPLIRRLPKRGFTSKFKRYYEIINVQHLNIFKDGEVITPKQLEEKGLVHKRLPVKILGDGELKKKLNVEAHKFSKTAVEKIKKIGGTATVAKNKPC